MKIRSAGRPQLTLESVAMTDIIMNMFVFFFISFSLLYTFNPQRESKIKVNLPKGVTDVKSRGEKPLVVTVTGQIFHSRTCGSACTGVGSRSAAMSKRDTQKRFMDQIQTPWR